MSKPKPIADQLRQAIRAAEARGLTQYAIAKAAGIDRSQLTRLFKSTVAPRLDTAERIADACGMRLKLEKR